MATIKNIYTVHFDQELKVEFDFFMKSNGDIHITAKVSGIVNDIKTSWTIGRGSFYFDEIDDYYWAYEKGWKRTAEATEHVGKCLLALFQKALLSNTHNALYEIWNIRELEQSKTDQD